MDEEDALLSERQIRYLALEGVVKPQHDADGLNGARLYSEIEVALLRVFMTLRDETSPWVAKVIFTYEGKRIREVLRKGTDTALVVAGLQGRFLPQRQANALPYTSTQIPLRPLHTDVRRRMRKLRRDTPELWTGSRYVPAQELAQAL